MKYLLLVVLFLTVSCNKDETPQYSPIYSKIQGDWYTEPRNGFITRMNFSKAEDSVYTEYMYPTGSTVQEGTKYKYYINNINKLFIKENDTTPWIDRKEVKIVNDTLNCSGFKLHR